MKLSEDVDKVTMPGCKDAYRLFGADGNALLDLLQQPGESVVNHGTRVLCRHPFQVTQFTVYHRSVATGVRCAQRM